MTSAPQSTRRNNLLSVGGQLASQGFAVLSLLILLRLISREAYGMWALYLTVLSMAEMARAGFVQNGLVTYLQSHPADRLRIVGSAYVLNLLLGLLLWGAMVLLAYPLSVWWSTPELPLLAAWYGVFMLTLGGLRFWEYVQIAHQDFRGVLLGNLLYGAGQCVGMAVWWGLGYRPALVEIVWLQAGTAALATVAVWLYRRPLFRWGRPALGWMRTLAAYGRYVLGTNLGSMLLQRTDVIMLGYYLGPAAVAPYTVALRLMNYLEIPLKGLATAAFPRLARAWQDDGPAAAARLHDQTTAHMLAMTLPACLVLALAAGPAVRILAGPGYDDAVSLLRILLLFALLKPWGRMFGTALDAIGQPQVNFRYILLGLLLNVVFNALLIPLRGGIGAALATVLAILLMAGINHWHLRRLMPVRLGQVLTRLGDVYRQGSRRLLGAVAIPGLPHR
ncbi:MAG: flippase [Bacteroidia bacterium]